LASNIEPSAIPVSLWMPQHIHIILVGEVQKAGNRCSFLCSSTWLPTLFQCSAIRLNHTTWAGRKAVDRTFLSRISKVQRQISKYKLVMPCIVRDSNPLIFHSFPSSSCCHGDFFSPSYYILQFSKNFIASGPSSLMWDTFHCSWWNTQR
jgi:hypothetical protein